ncbi:FMN-binding protein [Asticcacaulis solisilvae]|uniref:FMN-binding protein n=1 Tax=Asticcacaulis solisilvae TaxID=1217274 RepID=UPI003FD70FCA
MKSAIRFLPLAALAVAPAAAHATVYFTLEQAQAQMLPGQKLTAVTLELTDAQVAAIQKDSGEAPVNRQLRAWKAGDGSWFILDQVVGKHEFITYAVAIDPGGGVKGVEILDYRETFGDQVRQAAWRAQFTGRHHGQSLKLGKDIQNISGATLSSKHITDGVRRLLSTHALVLGKL